MKFEAVLFDCDGVLVDSEPITNGVLREMLQEMGWVLSVQDCYRLFVGRSVYDEAHTIEQRTGVPIDSVWIKSFQARRDVALHERLEAVDGIHAAVQWAHERSQGRLAVASGADRGKIHLQLGKVGLLKYFEPHIVSGQEMPRNKPHPDVYLAAAASLGVAPSRCAVVEDTVTGVAAGVAAGAMVLAYAPSDGHGSGEASLRAAGAQHVFTSMQDLPMLLAKAE
jgi:HAD superfamily hydrolase (TIGR01509 family)